MPWLPYDTSSPHTISPQWLTLSTSWASLAAVELLRERRNFHTSSLIYADTILDGALGDVVATGPLKKLAIAMSVLPWDAALTSQPSALLAELCTTGTVQRWRTSRW